MVLDAVGRRIRRSGPNPALVERLSGWRWGTRSVSGKPVSDEGALSLTAWYGGVKLIARTVAGLPMQVYDESGENAVKVKTEATRYLWHRPNPEMTHQTFWERILGDEVRGNAFIFVEKLDTGMPKAIWYVERNRVRVGRTSGGIKVYEVDDQLPMIDYKQGGEIVHIPNWGGALLGYDPLKIAPNAFALGMSAEEYASKFYTENGVPPGIISTDQILTQKQADDLLKLWQDQRAKAPQSTAFLGNGAKFQQLSIDAEKSQQAQIRTFQVQEIGRLLNLPPFLLGDVDHASQGGGNGMEEQNRGLLIFNFQGHINAIEQAVSDDLLVRELTDLYVKLNLNAFLRGSTLQRFQAYKLADFLTPNEKRALEDLPPVDGGDTLIMQMQDVPIDKLGESAMAAGGGK